MATLIGGYDEPMRRSRYPKTGIEGGISNSPDLRPKAPEELPGWRISNHHSKSWAGLRR